MEFPHFAPQESPDATLLVAQRAQRLRCRRAGRATFTATNLPVSASRQPAG